GSPGQLAEYAAVLIDDDGDIVMCLQHRVERCVQTLVTAYDSCVALLMRGGELGTDLTKRQRSRLLQPQEAYGRSGADEGRHEVVGGVGEDACGSVVLGEATTFGEDRDPVAELDR